MKRAITLTMTLIFVFSCKNKNTAYSKPIKGVEEQSIILPNHPLWVLNRLSLTKVKEDLNQTNKQLFILSRTSTTKTAYASVNNIPVEMGNYYRTSILVKKDGLGVSFGLRIIGEYPNRVDAVFDLEKGLIKGVSDVGTFIKGAVRIPRLRRSEYFRLPKTGHCRRDRGRNLGLAKRGSAIGPDRFWVGREYTKLAPIKRIMT